jgi:hypothetical protein
MKTKSLFFVSMLTVLAPVQPMVLMAIFTIILDMALAFGEAYEKTDGHQYAPVGFQIPFLRAFCIVVR